MNVRQRLASSLGLLAAVVIVATEGYRYFSHDHVSYLDAVYMAVITIATVGYGEVIDSICL
jgi:voltage-gated potassium channel